MERKKFNPDEPETKGLNLSRYQVVTELVKISQCQSVLDMGCGIGMFLRHLKKNSAIENIHGVDISDWDLQVANKRGSSNVSKGSILEPITEYKNFDAVTILEVIEHLKPEELDMAKYAIFSVIHPRKVIITTPNREYNTNYKGLYRGKFRHKDHQFEFTRNEFLDFCNQISERYGYGYQIIGIGDTDAQGRQPTQACLFTRREE
jgi:SAM-dependent methyltransferase